jgi:hypothetical protein
VPLIALAIANRHRRKQAGDHVLGIRDLYRGRRSLIWLVPLAAALAIPIAGAVDKIVQAIRELLPGQPVNGSWRGDVTHYFAWNWFFSLPDSPLGYVLFALIIGLAVMALWHAPRPLAIGLGGLLLFGLAFGVYLRHLQDAYYFEFKLLAFVGPLIVLTAIIGAWRLRPLCGAARRRPCGRAWLQPRRPTRQERLPARSADRRTQLVGRGATAQRLDPS